MSNLIHFAPPCNFIKFLIADLLFDYFLMPLSPEKDMLRQTRYKQEFHRKTQLNSRSDLVLYAENETTVWTFATLNLVESPMLYDISVVLTHTIAKYFL